MRHYPVFLDLGQARCLLAGLGGVGRRKLATLLECAPAEVLVLDPGLPAPVPEEIATLLTHPAVIFERRVATDADIEGRLLVIAATADRAANARLAAVCRTRNVLCNVVDDPTAGNFLVPATATVGDLTVAISTAGASPALARALRQDLQDYLGLRYESLLTAMARLRPLVLALGQTTERNTETFRGLVESPLAAALANKDRAQAQAILTSLLPDALHPRINEVLHGLV